jgi:hypothetical protein
MGQSFSMTKPKKKVCFKKNAHKHGTHKHVGTHVMDSQYMKIKKSKKKTTYKHKGHSHKTMKALKACKK